MIKISEATKILALMMAMGTCAVVPPGAQAQAPKRINWVKEGRHLVWEVEVPAGRSKEYVFSAHKGQRLSLSFIDDTGKGSMDLGKYSVEPNTDPMKMTIEVSKDYTLTVTNNSSKATSFRIGFDLDEPKGVAAPAKAANNPLNFERVRFPQNSIEVNLEKSVLANNAKRFLFAAKAGQEISFTITPKSANATLHIDFAGKQVPVGQLFTMVAPRTKDYLLQVTNYDDSDRAFQFDLGIATPQKQAHISSAGRIRLPKGQQVADIKGTLGAKQSKKYVAYVLKGNMICIVPQDNLGSNIRVRLDGKEFDFRDSTYTDHLTQSKDHIIEIYNTANRKSAFGFSIGFSEHG